MKLNDYLMQLPKGSYVVVAHSEDKELSGLTNAHPHINFDIRVLKGTRIYGVKLNGKRPDVALVSTQTLHPNGLLTSMKYVVNPIHGTVFLVNENTLTEQNIK